MLDERGENQIKKQAQGDMVVILNQFKHKRRLVKLYRYGMYAALVISCIIFTLVGLYQLDHRIPSTIYVRAGMEQSCKANLEKLLTDKSPPVLTSNISRCIIA